MSNIALEVCVDSINSAIASAQGGASRIELCSALSEGGLTPTVGTLKAIKNLSLNIPIYCMLRPTCGNGFNYSTIELDALLTDLEILRSNGADGFVFGALNKSNSIDKESCHKIVREATLPVTFHRAFDITDPLQMNQNVELIKSLGFTRILTSGFKKTAFEGAHILSQLIEANKNIIIMPGGGINANNLEELLQITKFTEFHSSGKNHDKKHDSTINSETINLGTQNLVEYEPACSIVIQKLVSIARMYKV